MMTRVETWPDLLIAYVEERRNVPFSWGSNDCCLFAADWVLRATNVDPAQSIRGTYDSALSAARVLDSLGGIVGVVRSLAEPLGAEPVALGFAKRGDLIVAEIEGKDSLGVVVGGGAVAFVGESGLVFLPKRSLPNPRCWAI